MWPRGSEFEIVRPEPQSDPGMPVSNEPLRSLFSAPGSSRPFGGGDNHLTREATRRYSPLLAGTPWWGRCEHLKKGHWSEPNSTLCEGR